MSILGTPSWKPNRISRGESVEDTIRRVLQITRAEVDEQGAVPEPGGDRQQREALFQFHFRFVHHKEDFGGSRI